MLTFLAVYLYTGWIAYWNKVRGGMPGIPYGRIIASVMTGLGTADLSLFLGMHTVQSIEIGAATAIGYFVWAVFGWSFDEQVGRWDKIKYPAYVQAIGRFFYPKDEPYSNRMRGIIMKGIRGGQDSLPLFVFYALLISPYALLPWLIFFAQGLVYNFYYDLDSHGIDPVGYGEWTWGAIGIAQSIVLALLTYTITI